ncbi:hypothetical protein [Eubacterium aggregans]|uniref:hypothetical protein n=1 Tax=Eubacterium aggregans TaxID=81409 RepID=UPI003F398C86
MPGKIIKFKYSKMRRKKWLAKKKEQKKNRDFMEPSKELEKAMFDLEGMEELTDIDSMWCFINGGGNWIVGS